MTHVRTRRFAPIIAVILLAASLAFPALASAITRDMIIARGQVWVDLNVPYSQSSYATVDGRYPVARTQGYRTDCSGFVSMCLGLVTDGSPRSLDTASLPVVLDRIESQYLSPGDVVLKPKNPAAGISGHTVIFVGWTDDTHTTFTAYEEGSSATGTLARVRNIDTMLGDGYSAYRYKDVQDDFADCQVPLAGPDRYATAVEVSRAASEGTTDTVVLASGETWPDALGGAALAGAVDAPVLLTASGSLPWITHDEIKRLSPAKIYILGGTNAISSEVADALAANGTVIERLGGANRYETSALVAEKTVEQVEKSGKTVDRVYVATGSNFPDALAVAPIAANFARPVLLTETDSVPVAITDALKNIDVDAISVLGGESVVTVGVEDKLKPFGTVDRLAAADRYSTASTIAQHGVADGMRWQMCGLASGEGFADALAGGTAQGLSGSVLLLTRPAALPAGSVSAISAKSSEIETMTLFGGMKVITYPVRTQVAGLLRAGN